MEMILFCENCRKIRLSFKYNPLDLNKKTKKLTLSPMDFMEDDKMTKTCPTCNKPLIYTQKSKVLHLLEGNNHKKKDTKRVDKSKDRSFFELYLKMIDIFSKNTLKKK